MSLAVRLIEWAEAKRSLNEAEKAMADAKNSFNSAMRLVMVESKGNKDVTIEWQGKLYYIHINHHANQISMKEVELL